jgi:hypothetical protein
MDKFSYDLSGNRIERFLALYREHPESAAETDAGLEAVVLDLNRDEDDESKLGYHDRRYFDPTTTQRISQEPIAFAGDDPNVTKYVSNGTEENRACGDNR